MDNLKKGTHEPPPKKDKHAALGDEEIAKDPQHLSKLACVKINTTGMGLSFHWQCKK